jgi:quercetin dioxygenase-like cupin family protein
MPQFIHLYSDPDGAARFENWAVSLMPDNPAPDELSMSVPLAANAAVFVQAPPGGGHVQQPEASRQLVVVLAGECDVTASGETRTGRPGDVMLVEDTAGEGHSSRTRAGFLALMIALPPETPG